MRTLRTSFIIAILVAIASAQDNRYCSSANVWTGNTSDGPASLPQRCINTALVNTPSPGFVVPLMAGQSLQLAYNALSCGSTLLLAHGVTWDAPFAFAAKGCDGQHWITIKSDGSLPPEGTRITAASQTELAILSFSPRNSPATFGDHLRFIGIAWIKKAGTQLLGFGTLKGSQHIIFDRNRFLGNPGEETRRGLGLANGQSIAIIDSEFREFHCLAPGSCVEAQAISGGIGDGMAASGPIKIVDNMLEASTENILFGGDAADGCGPNDVEIRRNHMYKPMAWNPNDPNYIGVKYTVKNLLELKNGSRILIEGNVMENTWGGFSQTGFGLLFTPKNQSINGVNLCPLCAVLDTTFRYNRMSNVAAFVTVATAPSATGGWSAGQHRTSIHDVVIDGIQYPTCYGCANFLGDLTSGYSSTNPPPSDSVLSDILVNHITQVSGLGLASGAIPLGWLQLNGPPQNNPTGTQTMQNVSWVNSISLAGSNGTFPTGGGTNNCSVQQGGVKNIPVNQLASCFFGSSQFTGNVFVAYPKPITDWPAGNFFVADWPALGMANYSGSIGGDYHLTLASPAHTKALDGRDPGADIDMVNLFTEGVE